MPYILLVAGALSCSSIYQLFQTKDLSQHLVGSILLEPSNALPHALLTFAVVTSRWRWVGPAVLMRTILSFASLLSWMMTYPASPPGVLQRWDGFGASMGGWLASSCMCAAAHFTFNLRFKYGVVTALAWIVLAPGVAHHMPADVHAWPLIGAMVIVSLLQLYWELKARSLFKDVYYPTHEPPGVPAPVEEPRGSPVVGEPRGRDIVWEPRAGEILDLLQEGSCSTSQAAVLSQQASKSSLSAHFCEFFFGFADSAKKEQCVDAAAHVEDPTNEVSDLQTYDSYEEISSGCNQAAAMPMHYTTTASHEAVVAASVEHPTDEVSDLQTYYLHEEISSGSNHAAAMPMHYTTTTSHEADVAASVEHPIDEVSDLQTYYLHEEISSGSNQAAAMPMQYTTPSTTTTTTSHDADVDASVEDPTDELSDQDIYDMIDAINNGTYGELATPKHHTVWLRIPDADPDDLAPDAKIKLREHFEAENPGYVITDIVFLRGSLLVGVRIRPDGSRSADASAAQVMKASKLYSWLAWLGLPTHMDVSMEVNIPSERRTSLLAAFPLAVTLPKSEESVRILSLPLWCSELPSGVAIKASLGNHILACDIIQAGVEDVPSGSHTNGQGRITLNMKLPMDTLLCESSCWVLNVIVQDLDDHVIVGDKHVVLFDEALAEMAPELCSMRLLRPEDMPHSLRSPGVDQPWGAEVVYALGLWLQTMHTEHRLADSGLEKDLETVDHVILQQLADMWRAGNHLLMHLVGNGCKDSAKHVIDLLLNSPALRACVHGRVVGEGLDDIPSFHDFISGTHNTKGCTIMHLAVLSGSYTMVDEVIGWSDAYNVPCQWAAWDKAGMTPLHVAVLVKDGDMARFLLQKKDSALLQAWQSGDGRHAKSAEHFSRRMAKMSAIAGSGFNQRGSSRTSIHSLPRQRPHRMTGRTTLTQPCITPGGGTSSVASSQSRGTAGAQPRDTAGTQPRGTAGTQPSSLVESSSPAKPPQAQPSSLIKSPTSAQPIPAKSSSLGVAQPSQAKSSSPGDAQSSQDMSSSLGDAVPHPHKWYLRMKQLWSSLEPLPDANQEKKFIMYKMGKLSAVMLVLCSIQAVNQTMVFIKGGLGFLSLHAILVICCFTVPTYWTFYKGNYSVAEKLLFAWALWRKVFFHHIHCHGCVSFVTKQLLTIRPVRAVAEPLRFRWSVAENLFTLILNCILPDGWTLHWILLSHVLGLLVSVAIEMRARRMFMSLEKAQ